MAPATERGACDIDGLRLSSGQSVRLRLDYTSQGPNGTPTYLLLHGYTGSHLALMPDPEAADSGWASTWIGPGRVLDTRRVRILTVNLPGSSYGSNWQGADDDYAPVVGMASMIDSWLEALGVQKLEGVIGYSFGGYVALALKAWHPLRVSRALAICSASRGRGSLDELDALQRLDSPEKRFAWRIDALSRAGLSQWAEDHGADALAREHANVRRWSREFSAASLWRLRAAAATFELPCWPAQSTALHSSSDLLFPPPAAGADPGCTVRTRYGHQALLLDPAPWHEPIGRWVSGQLHPSSSTETRAPQESP